MAQLCRICGSARWSTVVDLGHHPLADRFLYASEIADPETYYPLAVRLCRSCGYAGLTYVVSPDNRYRDHDYSYTASNSSVAIKHFDLLAAEALRESRPEDGDLVVDIGGNDGTLLKSVASQHPAARLLNVEPAPNIADLAEASGIPTHRGFFDAEAKHRIAESGGARVVFATNVLNHVADLHPFCRDLASCLAYEGILVIEVPWLLELLRSVAFDTIYLEHVSYFGLRSLAALLREHGLHIFRAHAIDYMGGSLRVFASRGREPATGLDLAAQEESAKLDDPQIYSSFMERVKRFRLRIGADLHRVVAEGGKIAGIGAATKGNTLLNYCRIDRELVECVADASPHKVGKFTPGTHLPIVHDDDLPSNVTHGLILPWNIGTFLRARFHHAGLELINIKR